MATLTVYPSGYDSTNSVYASISPSYPVTNGYNSTSNTNLARINLVTGSNAESIFYYTFDLTSLPSTAVISSVSCDVKASIDSDTGITSKTVYMTTGTTKKGSEYILPTSSSTFSLSVGTWTVSELKNSRVCIYAKRGTTDTSTTRYFRFYGATLTVVYTENPILWKKQNGIWYRVNEAFLKSSGAWTTYSNVQNLFNPSNFYKQRYILPSGYTLLSYVQSTGAQYVDTGIVPDANTKVEAEFQLTQVDTTNRVMFGVLGQFTFRKYTTPAFRTNGNNYVNFTDIPADTAWHYVSKIPTSCTLVSEDGTTETKTNTVGTCTLTMSIFGYHSAASTYEQYAYMNLYYLKVYSSNTLVRYFIPSKNASNVVGLYDIVNNVFYSSGTSTALVEGDTLIKVP